MPEWKLFVKTNRVVTAAGSFSALSSNQSINHLIHLNQPTSSNYQDVECSSAPWPAKDLWPWPLSAPSSPGWSSSRSATPAAGRWCRRRRRSRRGSRRGRWSRKETPRMISRKTGISVDVSDTWTTRRRRSIPTGDRPPSVWWAAATCSRWRSRPWSSTTPWARSGRCYYELRRGRWCCPTGSSATPVNCCGRCRVCDSAMTPSPSSQVDAVVCRGERDRPRNVLARSCTFPI